ncbi:response regulator [bacterium]|nr:MAG: response regulator [bacterium]
MWHNFPSPHNTRKLTNMPQPRLPLPLPGGKMEKRDPEFSTRVEDFSLTAVILLVDDDEPVRVMLARVLRTQGYVVLQAENAIAAYRVLEERKPDLIISDIVMPGESGIELRRNLAARWPEIPAILISGYSSEGPAEFAARTPNTVFVQKPFAADQFLALVESTLAGPAATSPSPPE